VIAMAIRLESKGPALFRQPRVGRGNRIFQILKFRSMRSEAGDGAGSRSTTRDDDRVTRLGRFLRRTSLDELPQLLNVVLGDMSLVGPRPHALSSRAEEALFWEIEGRYWERHSIKPGITGLAQVRGFRGATHKRADLTNRVASDLEYVIGWNLLRDISILLRTLRVIVHANAY
jgi:polysaccharide biosynthesis protein PslA